MSLDLQFVTWCCCRSEPLGVDRQPCSHWADQHAPGPRQVRHQVTRVIVVMVSNLMMVISLETLKVLSSVTWPDPCSRRRMREKMPVDFIVKWCFHFHSDVGPSQSGLFIAVLINLLWIGIETSWELQATNFRTHYGEMEIIVNGQEIICLLWSCISFVKV